MFQMANRITLILWLCCVLRANTAASGVYNNAIGLAEESKSAFVYENVSDLSHHTEADIRGSLCKRLSRSKRVVAFPVGSSLSCAICTTTGVIGNPNLLFLSMGLNWGITYDLPNITWVLQNMHGLNKNKNVVEAQSKRRHRRELYGRLETLMSR